MNTKAKRVYKALRKKGFNDAACAGAMSNIEAESSYRPELIEKAKLKALGVTAEEYMASYQTSTTFATDHVGIGLCQWSFRTRKQALKDRCDKAGVTILDFDQQIKHLFSELKHGYKDLYLRLMNCGDTEHAAGALGYLFCEVFEKPKAGVVSCKKREARAIEIYREIKAL